MCTAWVENRLSFAFPTVSLKFFPRICQGDANYNRFPTQAVHITLHDDILPFPPNSYLTILPNCCLVSNMSTVFVFLVQYHLASECFPSFPFQQSLKFFSRICQGDANYNRFSTQAVHITLHDDILPFPPNSYLTILPNCCLVSNMSTVLVFLVQYHLASECFPSFPFQQSLKFFSRICQGDANDNRFPTQAVHITLHDDISPFPPNSYLTILPNCCLLSNMSTVLAFLVQYHLASECFPSFPFQQSLKFFPRICQGDANDNRFPTQAVHITLHDDILPFPPNIYLTILPNCCLLSNMSTVLVFLVQYHLASECFPSFPFQQCL